jgi:hypothetical protein
MAKDPHFDEGHAPATPAPVTGAPTSAPDGPDPDLTVTHTSKAARAVEPPETPRTEELEGTLARELRPTRVVPRWAGWLVIAAGVAMLPWITGLSFVLPTSHEAAHYDDSWVGFDLGLCAMLLRTGWLAQKGREHIELSAAITGTLLLVDAWFDVVTAGSHSELTLALALALFCELPLAVFFLWIAGRVEYRRQRRAEAMSRLLRGLRMHRSRVARTTREPRRP